MVFEYSSGRIELFELAPGDDGFGGYAMCDKHAGAMTAPVGWTLTDSRPESMTLFPLSGVEPAGAPAPAPVPDSVVA